MSYKYSEDSDSHWVEVQIPLVLVVTFPFIFIILSSWKKPFVLIFLSSVNSRSPDSHWIAVQGISASVKMDGFFIYSLATSKFRHQLLLIFPRFDFSLFTIHLLIVQNILMLHFDIFVCLCIFLNNRVLIGKLYYVSFF